MGESSDEMPDPLHLDDAQLRELLHLMSHDLRNPLAAIVTNLEFAKRLLSRLSVDPDLSESVDDSVTACDVLRQIVANFDLLVKGRDLTVTLHEIDVAATVADVAKRCRERAEQAGLAIDLREAQVPMRTMIDKSLFALAVENLIANSLQHAPRRSTVVIELRSGAADRADVVIADEGPAIAEALRETALGPQGHTHAGRNDGTRYGRGLGLLAANAAAAACGCELSVGGETTSVFTIGVPLINPG